MVVMSMKDYAQNNNITYEAVRKQVARYREDLEGHITKDGRQQFLDEFAISFLDERRQKNPIVIYQQSKDEAIEALRADKEALLIKLAEQNEKMDTLRDRLESLQQLQLEAKNAILALEAAEKAKAELQLNYDKVTEDLEKTRSEAQQRAIEAQQALHRELEAVQKAEKTALELTQTNLQLQKEHIAKIAAEEARVAMEKAKQELEDSLEKEKHRPLTLWERLTGRKK